MRPCCTHPLRLRNLQMALATNSSFRSSGLEEGLKVFSAVPLSPSAPMHNRMSIVEIYSSE